MISYNYTGQQLLSSGIREFFYEGFEENASATTANKYAGDKSYAGSYQVPFTMPNSRSYIVEYHYYNGSQWVYVKKPYTNNMILSDGPYIDEVRVYPSDALMTTYTYEPLYGLSSETDMSGKTIFYEYDGFQRLKNVKDYQGNIIKSYQYNYAH
jgi:YD repeat-containing protein